MYGIKMLKEFNSFKILVTAVHIGNPLTVLLAVVKIQH